MRIDEPTRQAIANLKRLAERSGLTDDELSRICKLTSGYNIDHLTISEAVLVVDAITGMGAARAKQWAQELQR